MSEEIELRLKRRIQVIVVAAMSLFFVLVTVLVFQFGILIYQDVQKNAFARDNAAYEEKIRQAQHDMTRLDDPDFIEELALRYHNRARPGDIIVL
jgi:cell division protein FtsB